MVTLKLIAVFFVLFSFAMFARYKAGGSLSSIESSLTTIRPAYWLTKKERIAREHWRIWGNASLYVSVFAIACAFVSWVGV